jgi:methyltransferase of ATP-grasp peptide maturase system
VSAPTDLNPDEQSRARGLLADLTAQLIKKGSLRTPEWRAVFERTWRHPYVPAYHPDRDTPAVLCFGSTRKQWLDTVYSDTTLLTKLQAVPLSRALRPAMTTMYTSSSTLPSLMLTMLELLDVAGGHRVLEIGTGTGYNAALLCERLGSSPVTSVDIDPELIDLGRERLADNGYAPTLAVADGAGGYSAGAPYDRIISTCAVARVPSAWLTQAAPGAVILTDVHGPLGGTLARLTVDDRGTATGRFVPFGTGFMNMRHDVEPEVAHWPRIAHAEQRSWTTIDPNPIMQEGIFGFILQWLVPRTTRGPATDADGQPVVFLLDRDGSRAEVATCPSSEGYLVRQYGERRLWDEVERANDFWESAGRPTYEQFGITATTQQQYVWHGNSGSANRWELTPD